MTAASFMVNKNLFIVPVAALIISMILLLIAFSAGWFYINKLGILNYSADDSKEEITSKSVQNFRKFFEGVGVGFLKTLLSYVILFLLYTGIMFCLFKLCLILIGEPKLIYEFPKLANATSQAEILNIVNSFTTEDKIVFSLWLTAINVTTSIVNFFFILYFAVNTFEKYNVIQSLWISIKFFFKNIMGVISILIFMFLLYLTLNILSILLGAGVISFVILIILFAVYLNYYLILVFCFYNDRTKDNCDNRTELIR